MKKNLLCNKKELMDEVTFKKAISSYARKGQIGLIRAFANSLMTKVQLNECDIETVYCMFLEIEEILNKYNLASNCQAQAILQMKDIVASKYLRYRKSDDVVSF